jgi:hypothetical protein
VEVEAIAFSGSGSARRAFAALEFTLESASSLL